jgi:hypothetical protein
VSRRRWRLLVAAPLVVAGLVACGTDSMTPEQVAEGAAEALEAQAGFRPDVSCSDELANEVGAQIRCTLNVEGDDQEYGVTVTVTSVEDGTDFEVVVDEEPLE